MMRLFGALSIGWLLISAIVAVLLNWDVIAAMREESRRIEVNTEERPSDKSSAQLDSERVPLYPGAEVISIESTGPEGESVVLRTTDSTRDVADFYTNILITAGWMQVESEVRETGGRMSFFSTDHVGARQLGRYLDVSLVRWAGGSVQIELGSESVPDPQNYVQFPSAEQVRYAEIKDESHGYMQWVTTYTTKSSSEEIEAYYLEHLPNDGWSLLPTPDEAGTVFVFSRRGWVPTFYYSLGIIARDGFNGLTEVEIRVGGYGQGSPNPGLIPANP